VLQGLFASRSLNIALEGSVRFQGKQCSEHTPDHYKLY
jgi:hypothetical protein